MGTAASVRTRGQIVTFLQRFFENSIYRQSPVSVPEAAFLRKTDYISAVNIFGKDVNSSEIEKNSNFLY